jgi:EpsI family protein
MPRRNALMGLAMAGTALASLVMRPQQVPNPRRTQPLEAVFPDRFAGWQPAPEHAGVMRPATEQADAYRIYDQVLERVYANGEGDRIMLSVAYGSQQSEALKLHRPEVCYEGGGFQVGQVQPASLVLAGQPVPATRLWARHPQRSEPITYWTVLGDQVQDSALAFRWRQVLAGLRGHWLDGMLVRVSSIDTQTDRAWRLQAEFADALVRAVPEAQRHRVVGRPAPAP